MNFRTRSIIFERSECNITFPWQGSYTRLVLKTPCIPCHRETKHFVTLVLILLVHVTYHSSTDELPWRQAISRLPFLSLKKKTFDIYIIHTWQKKVITQFGFYIKGSLALKYFEHATWEEFWDDGLCLKRTTCV